MYPMIHPSPPLGCYSSLISCQSFELRAVYHGGWIQIVDQYKLLAHVFPECNKHQYVWNWLQILIVKCVRIWFKWKKNNFTEFIEFKFNDNYFQISRHVIVSILSHLMSWSFLAIYQNSITRKINWMNTTVNWILLGYRIILFQEISLYMISCVKFPYI